MLRDEPGAEPGHVLVVATLGAPQRRMLRGSRSRRRDPGEIDASPVATTRVTVIEADASPGSDAAEAWLAGARSATGAQAAIDDAVRVVNAALQAWRLASADPWCRDVDASHALVTRIGHGTGEQVAEGRWTDAFELPQAPRSRAGRRVAVLRPQERFAALLGASEPPLACEELTARARTDVEAGRTREAALQIRIALEAAIAELGGSDRVEPSRIEELSGLRERVAAAANAALAGPIDEAAAAASATALGRIEAALRARAAARS